MANPNQDKKQARPVGLGVGPLLDSAAMAQFQNQQPDSIPGMFKPGEFVLPPDTVHALGGKAVLQDAVNRTHTPGNSSAIVPAGFKPEMFFAQGGAPEDEIKKANSFGDAAAASQNPSVRMIPTDYDKRTPMPDGSQNNPMNSEVGRNVTNTLNAIPGAAAVPGALGVGAVLAGRALGAAAPAVSLVGRAAQVAGPYAPVVGGAAALSSGAGASSTPSAASPVSSPAASSPAPSPQPQAMAAAPAAQSVQAALPAGPSMSGAVTRVGNSYSGTIVGGDISINGGTPSGGFVGGVGALLQRSTAQSPADQVPQFNSPQVAHSGNDWEARNNLRNLEVSASSITNNGGAFDSRRGRINGPSAAQSAFQDAQRADLTARGVQPVLDSQTNQLNSNLQREGMQQRGSDFRGGVQALLDQQRIDQAGVTAGYANRAAGQAEQMRDRIMNETDPAKRRALTDTMMAMEGKQTQADPYLVVPGGQHVDAASGRAYSTPSSVFNRQTGQWVQQPSQGPQQPSENHIAWLKQNPGQAANFDQIYGQGAAKRVMG